MSLLTEWGLTFVLSPFLCGLSLEGNEEEFYTDWEETFQSFDQMNLNEGLLRGIYAYGKRTCFLNSERS